MKNLTLTTTVEVNNPALEAEIEKEHSALTDLALLNAKFFGQQNKPEPIGDSLPHYIGEIKSRYETLGSQVLKKLQPNIHEIRMDADYYKEKVNKMEQKITDLMNQNVRACYELGKNPYESMSTRIKGCLLLSFLILIGEIAINSQALQITGGNLLSSFLIAFSISIAVTLFSHLAGFWFKKAKSKILRRLIFVGSILLVSGVFIAISMLRTLFLAKLGITLNPIYFTIFNIFFFIVSFLISIFLFPSIEEIKQNWKKSKIIQEISKRKQEIEILIKQIDEIKKSFLEQSKQVLRTEIIRKHYIQDIDKKCSETVEAFKRTNMTYRTDRKVPNCFTHEPIKLEIEDPSLTLNLQNRKAS